MRTTVAPCRSLLVALLLLGLSAPAALAQEVWRIAGTMNGWNQLDDSWALGRDGDALSLERRIEKGTYRFKFVRNGAWGQGHLGGAGDGTLEQPGRDLVLEVRATGVYRVTLDPRDKAWSWSPVEISEPLLDVVVRGTPTLGQTFLLDLSRSLLSRPGERPSLTARVTEGKASIRRFGERGLSLLVTPERAGALVIDLSIDERDGALTETLRLEALEPWTVDAEFEAGRSSFNRRTPLLASEPGVLRAEVWLKRDGVLKALTIRHGDEVVAQMAGPMEVNAGRYAVEVRDGAVTREPAGANRPAFLLAGGWTEFTFTPAAGQPKPGRVFLTGTFNRWAPVSSSEAIELASVATGEFRGLVRLPEGVHRYGFRTDDGRFLPDANNPETARGAGDELVSVVIVGPRPGDYPLPRPNDLNLDALRHDPARASDFVPISRGLGLADLSFTTLPDDARGASVLVDVAREDGSVERVKVACRRERDEAGFDRFTARVMSNGPTLTYAIALSDGDASWVSDDFTVTLPADPLLIPDWAKGAVWYQIFPERFRNGNRFNDPRGDHVYLAPWTSDWYSVSEEEYAAHRRRYNLEPGERLEARTGGDLFHVVWDRRYGGDLQGVVEKLDYLRDLGVTAIYLNPVFEGASMHKYDATDYRHIDDNFGTPEEAGRTPKRFAWPGDPTKESDDAGQRTWTAADRYFIDVLLPEAKRRGIRVVIDGVFNHVGREHFAFQDVLEKGRDSRFADWFFAEYGPDGSLQSWQAWDGPSGWLPKFRQKSNGDLVDPVKRHIFAVTERWMDPDGDGDPSDGIDGWRLDVPLDVGLPFWVEWRHLVKSINPDAIIVAEIWSDARDTLRGEHFDTQMHYPFAIPVLDWLGVKPRMRSDQLADALEQAFDEAPQTLLVHQNLFDSHDTDRLVSMLFNPGRDYDQGNRIQDGAAYRDVRPDEKTYELALLGVAIQATYMGAPMVYYGDEMGMWGADDPTNRKPMAWPDLGSFENPDDGPDPEIHKRYREWLRLRQDPVIGPVLRYGDLEHLGSGSADLFAYQRSLNGTTVRVAVNRSDRSASLRRLNREGMGPARVEARSAVYWVIDHDELETR